LHKIKDGGESLHNNAQRVEVWAGRDCFFFSRVSYQEEYWIGSAWMATDFLLGKTAPNKVHCGFCVVILMNENPPREKREFFCRAAQ